MFVVQVLIWHSGNGIERINEVIIRRARSVAGWVTIFRQAYHLGL